MTYRALGIIKSTKYTKQMESSSLLSTDVSALAQHHVDAAGEGKHSTAGRKRILVVDDSRTMRLMLRRWLERLPYDIIEAKDSDEAFAAFSRFVFDLVTVDIDMPGADGFSLCARLRDWEHNHCRAHTPILILTSHDTLVERERGFEVGASDFLPKPTTASELLVRVDRLLRSDHQLVGVTALVVDDSHVARKSIAAGLVRLGVRVIEAKDGVEAFEILRTADSQVDLLLTDYDMPKMAGDELCRRVRTTLGMPWLPIIILSALADRARVLELFSAGATDYLCKPFTAEELAARILVHVEMRRLNRERVRQIGELDRLNKLKDGFIAATSHDLRSPLNGLLGAAELLLADPRLGGEHRELAELVKQSGENMLQIINDLLDLARLEAGESDAKGEDVDIVGLADQTCKALDQIAVPKKIALCRVGGGDSAPVRVVGIKNEILRLLTNLVSNAIKFTPPGGKVTVATSMSRDRKAAIVSVADTGIGIPEEKIPLLFERFSKLSRLGTAGELSTGLGMAIVKEIVGRHAGQVHVQSEVGRGTVMTVTLPARG